MRVDLLCVKPVLLYKPGQTYPILAGQVQSFVNRGFFVRPEDSKSASPKPKPRTRKSTAKRTVDKEPSEEAPAD